MGVRHDFRPEFEDLLRLPDRDARGETKRNDTVRVQAAEPVVCIEDRYRVSKAAQISSGGKACRTPSDYCNPLSARRTWIEELDIVLHHPVDRIPL